LAARPWRGVDDPGAVLDTLRPVAEAALASGLIETWAMRELLWRDLSRPG
jgi:hypothetical protein